MRNPKRCLLVIGTLVLGALSPAAVRADDAIKHPEDHPHYSVELEPHLLLGWASNYYYGGGSGFGLGGRVSINLTHNGFVDTINGANAFSAKASSAMLFSRDDPARL